MPPKARVAKTTVVKARAAPSEPVQPPAWPPLKPLVPTCDLELETLLDDQLVLIHKLFTTSLCQKYVSFLSSLPLVTTPGQPKKGEALRVNDRFQIDDAAFAEKLWSSTGLKELITKSEQWGGKPVGLNPNIRIYRYKKGQFFDQHYDESNQLILPTAPPTPVRTTWTLLLYLTSSVGGETVFYPEHGKVKDFFKGQRKELEPIIVSPEVGLALLHKHGEDCLLHESREIKEGEKWVIRSDLCVQK